MGLVLRIIHIQQNGQSELVNGRELKAVTLNLMKHNAIK